MKHRHFSTMVALPAALLFACAASAQMRPQTPQPQTNPQQMPQTQPMPQTQTPPAIPTTTQTRQCANGTNCYNDNNTNGMRGQSFSTLAGSKGYVTQAEAQHDPWLSSHFDQCDRNQDGKVTRTEYQRCHSQNATGGQP